jgi:hypothetical protein
LVCGIALAFTGSARADLYPHPGLDPDAGGGGTLFSFYVHQSDVAYPDGSWTLPLQVSSQNPIDLLAVRITSGDPFQDPAFRLFTVDGWGELLNDKTLAVASGPGTPGSILFGLGFSGDIGAPVEFDIVAFSGDTMLGSAHGVWGLDGGLPWFQFVSGDWSPTRASLLQGAVPAPGSTVLAVLGLGLVGVMWRRFA